MPSFFLVSTTATTPSLVCLLLHLIVCTSCSTLLQYSSFAFVVKITWHITFNTSTCSLWGEGLTSSWLCLPITACVDAVTVHCPPPPPPLLKHLCFSLTFLPFHVYIPRWNVRATLRPALSISSFSTHHPRRPSFLSLLLAGWEFSSTHCHFCTLSFHFPFPTQEKSIRSKLPKVKFHYVYLRDSNTRQCRQNWYTVTNSVAFSMASYGAMRF